MRKTKVDEAKVLRLSSEYLMKNYTATPEIVEMFQITCEEIERFKLKNNLRTLPAVTQTHFKKIAVVEKHLRVELCEMALELKVVSIGRIIPTTDGFEMKSASADGYILANNPHARIVEFVNPLTKDFVNLLLAKI